MYRDKVKCVKTAVIMLVIFAVAVAAGLLAMNGDVLAAELKAGKSGTAYNYTIGKGSDGKYYVYKPGTVKFAANDMKVGGTVYTGYCVNFYDETWFGWAYESKNKSSSVKLSANGKKWLPYVLLYGYHKGKSSPVKGTNSNDYRAATEVMVWDFNEGWRTSATGKVKNDRAYKSIAGRPAAKIYKEMLSGINSHIKGPSFAKAKKKDAPTYKMTYNYSTGRYSVKLKDSRKANHFKAVKKDGLTIGRSGYTYTASVKKAGSYTVTWANDIKTGTKQSLLIWQAKSAVRSRQGVATGATDDTVFYTKFRTEKKGKLKLIKKSNTGKVSGFRIKVQAASGNSNGYKKTFTTDKDGVITSSIAPGKYKVTEVLTAAQRAAGWKIKGTNPRTVTLKEGKTTSVTLTNYKKPDEIKTGVKIVKTTNNDLSDLSGFRFRVRSKADDDVDAQEDSGDNRGTVDPVDKVFTTDKEGLIVKDLDPGTYEVTEEMTDEQAKRYREPAKAVFRLTEKNPVAEIRMENTEKRIDLQIVKTSDDDVIEGVQFTLTGTTAWGEEIEPVILTTDEKGEAFYEGLPAGEYTVTESTDEEKYFPQEPQTFTADEDDVVLSFHNKINSPVEISKESATTGEELPGASMEVRDAETGETVEKWTSGEEPHVLRDLEFGKKYILHEDLAPIGYAVASDIVFTAGFDEKVTMTDEVTRTTFVKKDADTGSMLAGAVIHIIDPDTKKTVQKFTTEKDHSSIIEMLKEGETYIAHEAKAPEGYQTADDVTFRAGADTEVVMKDKKKPEEKTVPEDKKKPYDHTPATGDNSSRFIGLLIILMIISLSGIYALYRGSERKNP